MCAVSAGCLGSEMLVDSCRRDFADFLLALQYLFDSPLLALSVETLKPLSRLYSIERDLRMGEVEVFFFAAWSRTDLVVGDAFRDIPSLEGESPRGGLGLGWYLGHPSVPARPRGVGGVLAVEMAAKVRRVDSPPLRWCSALAAGFV